MKVYIAGKITGDPGYRDKFEAAEIQLGWQGAHCAQACRAAGGHEPIGARGRKYGVALNGFGKTVFLTREEAEKAMKGETEK